MTVIMKLEPKKLPTLLLITDSPLVRSFFEEVIDKMEEMALIVASSKLEALDILRQTFISFIVIDEKTPDLELISFCTEIRTKFQHIPILVITGHLKKSFIRNVIKAGATDFLREPLDEDEFHLRMEIAQKATDTQKKMSHFTPHFSTESLPTTSLKKRAFLDDRAVRFVEDALSEKIPLSLILLQIDQYNQILKTRGKNTVEALILDVRDRLQKIMRPQDLLYNQNLGQFAIFLPKTSCKASLLIAENIHEYLSLEIFSAGNISSTLTASIGIASLDQVGDESKSASINLERLLTRASHYLNTAKEKTNTIVSKQDKKP